MKLFISWSGARSKSVARALRDLLPEVLQDAEPWMSEHDISAGQRWGSELNTKLDGCNIGIICITKENVAAPWLLFEAGSLAKSVASSRVIPYRLGINATDVPFPLAQFQGVDANSEGTKKLIETCNELRPTALRPDRLERVFSRWWPDLEERLAKIPDDIMVDNPIRSERSLLEEVLELVRRTAVPAPELRDYENNTVPKNAVWRSVHDVSPEEMYKMDRETLEKYITVTKRRWNETRIDGEEHALDRKEKEAKEILALKFPPGRAPSV
jgi:hypothetical protein